ncbi:hypothetical protein [Thalassomonas sp. M1454]|uniref:hypothetical protein n=1 Tax=Thalassomonas sp. M1454 TaxID=2594477 RepID=UPI00118102F2|nr:hypothetical protein [Thalassomonas sp. M1454]TRX57906.1 hypothetical protein FNN08_00525 [Thalassomonas sp. M1454]
MYLKILVESFDKAKLNLYHSFKVVGLMDSTSNGSNAVMLAIIVVAIVGYLNHQFEQRQQQKFNQYKVIKFTLLAQIIAYFSTFIATVLGYMFVVDPPEQQGAFVFTVFFALAYLTFIAHTFRYRSYFNEEEFITSPFYTTKLDLYKWQDIVNITEKNVGHQANNIQYTIYLANGKKWKLLKQLHTNCSEFVALATKISNRK